MTGTGVSEAELMNQNQKQEEERKARPSGRWFYRIGLCFIILNVLVLTPVILVQLYDMQHEVYQKKLEYELRHEYHVPSAVDEVLVDFGDGVISSDNTRRRRRRRN